MVIIPNPLDFQNYERLPNSRRVLRHSRNRGGIFLHRIMTTTELRELDAWIAEHVMGWAWYRFRMKMKSGKGFHRWQQLCPPDETWFLQPKYDAVKQPQGIGKYQEDETDYSSIKFTTDPAAAMEVLKKIIEKEDASVIYAAPDGVSYILCSDDIPDTYGETLELAICLFAKKLFTK